MPNYEVISLRVSTEFQETARAAAERHGLSISDLLRLGAELVAGMTPAQVEELLACPSCGGSGKRKFRSLRKPAEEVPDA